MADIPPGAVERIEGPTPNGGAYAIAIHSDADGIPCPRSRAAHVEIIEYDDDDKAIARTYADLAPTPPPSPRDP